MSNDVVIYAHPDTGGTYATINIGSSSTNQYRSHGFMTVTDGLSLKNLSIWVKKTGTPTGDLYCHIREDDRTSNYAPDSTSSFGFTATISKDDITTSYVKRVVDFSTAGITFAKHKKYFVVLYTTFNNASNYFQVQQLSSASLPDAFGLGINNTHCASSSADGITWSSTPTDPFWLKILGTSEVCRELVGFSGDDNTLNLTTIHNGTSVRMWGQSFRTPNLGDGTNFELEYMICNIQYNSNAVNVWSYYTFFESDGTNADLESLTQISAPQFVPAGYFRAASTSQLSTPGIVRFYDNKPILKPNTNYVVVGQHSADAICRIHQHTDSALYGDGTTYTIDSSTLAMTALSKDLNIFYLVGKDTSALPSTAVPNSGLFGLSTTWPIRSTTTESFGSASGTAYVAISFCSDVVGATLKSIRLPLAKVGNPQGNLYAKIYTKSIVTKYPIQEIADLGAIQSQLTSAYDEVIIDCSSANLKLTPRKVYWLVLYSDTINASNYFRLYRDTNTYGSSQTGQNEENEGTSSYASGASLSSMTFANTSFPMRIEVTHTETKSLISSLYPNTALPATTQITAFEDTAQYYFAIKVKMPNISKAIELEGIGFMAQSTATLLASKCWAEIYEYVDDTTRGSLITKSLSDNVWSNTPHVYATARKPVSINWGWKGERPKLSPNIYYYIFFYRDTVSTSNEWLVYHQPKANQTTHNGHTQLDATLFEVSSSLALTTTSNSPTDFRLWGREVNKTVESSTVIPYHIDADWSDPTPISAVSSSDVITFATPWNLANLSYLELGSNYGNRTIASGFYSTIEEGVLKEIRFKAKKVGLPMATLHASVYSTEKTDTTNFHFDRDFLYALVATTTVTVPDSTTFVEVLADFSSSSQTLDSDRKYFFVLHTGGSSNETDHWQIYGGSEIYGTARTGSNTWAHRLSASKSLLMGPSPAECYGEAYTFNLLAKKVVCSHTYKRSILSFFGTDSTSSFYDACFTGVSDQTVYQKFTTDGITEPYMVESLIVPLGGTSTMDGDNFIEYRAYICYDNSGTPGNIVNDPLGNAIPRFRDELHFTPGLSTIGHPFQGEKPVLQPNQTYWLALNAPSTSATYNCRVYKCSGNQYTGGNYRKVSSDEADNDFAFFVINGYPLGNVDGAGKTNVEALLCGTTYPNSTSYYFLGIDSTPDTYKAGIPFTPAMSGLRLSRISFDLKRNVAQPTAYLTNRIKVSVYGDTAGAPGTLLLAANETKMPTDEYANNIPIYCSFDFDGSLSLTAGTTYWAVIETTAGISAANYFYLGHIANAIVAETKHSTDGSTWVAFPTTKGRPVMRVYGKTVGGTDITKTIIDGTYKQQGTDRYQAFYNTTTSWGVGQRFKTPNQANNIKVQAFAFGRMLNTGAPLADKTAWVEIHTDTTNGGTLDLNTISTTRKGSASNTISRIERPAYEGSNAYLVSTVGFNWSSGNEPELLPNTNYIFFIRSDYYSATLNSWSIPNDSSNEYGKFDSNKRAALIYQSGTVSTADNYSLNTWAMLGYNAPIPEPPKKNFTLSWPLTNYVLPDDLIILWSHNLVAQSDWVIKNTITNVNIPVDFGLLWKLSMVADTTLLWTLIINPEADTTILYSILERTNKDIIIPWKIFVSSDTTLDIDLTMRVDRDIILRYILGNHVEDNWRLLWSFHLRKDYSIIYDIQEYKNRIIGLSWPLTTNLQDDYILLWKIFVSRDWTFPFPITNRILFDDTLNIPIMMAKDWGLPIGLMGTPGRSINLLWEIESKIYKDYVLKYGLSVTSDSVIRYSLRDLISRTYNILNEISSKIYQNYGIRYSIRIEHDCILIIPIQEKFNIDMVLDFSLTDQIKRDGIIKFNLLNYNPVETDHILRNTLLGKPRFYKITFE
jgi:hypothetical protein